MKTTNTFLLFSERIPFLLFLICIGFFLSPQLFAADITWDGGAGDGKWDSPTNWSADAIPVSVDNVTIGSGFIVTLSSDAGKINKILVQGKLIVEVTGILVIEQSVVSGTSIFELGGGEVENAGSIIITQLVANTNTGLKFADNTLTDDKFTNTGILTINMTAGALTSTAGNGINFNQISADRTATLKLGGTINFSAPPTSRFIEINAGNAIIDGTIVFGTVDLPQNYRFIHSSGGTLTLATTAYLTCYSGFNSSSNGTITMSTTATGGGIINNGTLSLHGGTTTGYGIYLNPQSSNTSTFTNAGTIVIDGSFPVGSIYLAGSTSTSTAIFNNQTGSSLTVINSNSGTNAAALRASVAPVVVFNNSGSMSLQTSITRNMYFGDNSATFNNSGNVTVKKAITGNDVATTPTACIINNNIGGVFNFDLSDNGQVAVSSNKPIRFNNNGGLVIGRGQFESGTFFPMTGTLSPGGNTGIGIFEFLQSQVTLTGKCIMQINGITTAGTDFDQIITKQPASNLDISGTSLEVSIGTAYSPTNQDIVQLFSAVGSLTGTFASVTAPTKWVANYTSTNANLLYDISSGSSKKSDIKVKVYSHEQTIIVKLALDETAQMQLTDMTGRMIKQAFLQGENNIINAADLKGIYIVHLVSATGHYTTKLNF